MLGEKAVAERKMERYEGAMTVNEMRASLLREFPPEGLPAPVAALVGCKRGVGAGALAGG
jgi:hypothetical protein